jgi:AcrR family transcriptional regulator
LSTVKGRLSGQSTKDRIGPEAGFSTMTLPGRGATPESAPKTRGRQRSEESEDAILSATLQLLKKKALREITIDEIARKAGVGKATIYKWWPSKAYVALDAFLRKMNRMVPNPDTGSAETDLKEQLQYLIAFYTSPTGRIYGQFLAEAQSDTDFATLLRERFVKPRREIVGVIFDRAVQRGEIDHSLDRDLILDLIYGPVIYRLLVIRAPFERERADAMVSTLFRGIGTGPTKVYG